MEEKTTRYKGVQITTHPAIDRPFDPDLAYYAEARHIFQSDEVGEEREVHFKAGGYSRGEAIRNCKMEIEDFLIEQKYGG